MKKTKCSSNFLLFEFVFVYFTIRTNSLAFLFKTSMVLMLCLYACEWFYYEINKNDIRMCYHSYDTQKYVCVCIYQYIGYIDICNFTHTKEVLFFYGTKINGNVIDSTAASCLLEDKKQLIRNDRKIQWKVRLRFKTQNDWKITWQ